MSSQTVDLEIISDSEKVWQWLIDCEITDHSMEEIKADEEGELLKDVYQIEFQLHIHDDGSEIIEQAWYGDSIPFPVKSEPSWLWKMIQKELEYIEREGEYEYAIRKHQAIEEAKFSQDYLI